MPISSFRLKSTIGRNYPADHDDTLRVKEALNQLGYYKIPASYGLTGYADETMFRGIEKLQDDFGLQHDGIMKPGGETEGAINEQLLSSTNQNSSNGIKKNPAVIQVAAAPAIARGAIQTLPLLAPFAKKAGEDLKRWWDAPELAAPESANENKRTTIIDPFPPLPEPVDPPKIDDKMEFPRTPPDIPMIEGRPINEVMKNDPVIFQALRDEVIREFQKPLHAHKGDEWTIKGHTVIVTDILPKKLAKYGPEKVASYRHTGGANDKDGKPLKEPYFPNIDTGGVAGSSNADLGIEIDGDQHFFNTGNTLIDGRTGVALERRNFVKLGRNVGSKLVGFLPKLRPTSDEREWYDRTSKLIEEYLERVYGPPKK